MTGVLHGAPSRLDLFDHRTQVLIDIMAGYSGAQSSIRTGPLSICNSVPILSLWNVLSCRQCIAIQDWLCHTINESKLAVKEFGPRPSVVRGTARDLMR